MKRHSLFLNALASAGAIAGGVSALRPTDQGKPYDAYFRAINEELKKNGPMRPCMVIDLDRMDRNLELVMQGLARSGKHLRIVEKSLPSFKLIDYIARRSRTNRLMSFHQPFLNIDAELFPNFEILLGKPLPVGSAAVFYSRLKGGFDPQRQLQWLLDTPERLIQYLELARGLGTKMRINIELDVGLHRGGAADFATLSAMLQAIVDNPDRLEFSGFVGYDGHVGPVRRFRDMPEQMMARAMTSYQRFVDFARQNYPGLWAGDITLNSGGSLSYTLHENESLSTEISIGKGFLKPKRGDTGTLADHIPAVFIAAPVIKATGHLKIPTLDRASRFFSWWDVNQRETFYLYGGNWAASYESPKGLQFNSTLGRSSNHEHVSGSPSMRLGVDDQVFLRPSSTEGILLQFGDLVILRDGKVHDHWPVFNQAS